MLRRFSINFAIFSMLLDALVILFGLRFSVEVRPLLNNLPNVIPIPKPVVLPSVLYFLFPFIWVLVFSIFAVYDGKKYLRAVDEFAALSLATLIASISAAGILYLSYRQVSRALFLFFVILVYSLFLSWRVIARLYFRIKKDRLNGSRRVLVVGVGPLGQRVGQQIRQSEVEDLSLVGFIDDSYKPVEDTTVVLGDNDAVYDVVFQKNITDVVIALPHSAYHQLGKIVQRLENVPVRIWIALGFFDLALYRTTIEDFVGIPMLDLRASAIDDYQLLVKRGFDLTLGLLTLLLTLPVMGLIALLILLDDGWPVIFKQKRVGENGKLFEMYKFRTMVRNAEQLQVQVTKRNEDGNEIHKSKNDPRVTRIGGFLRRFSLDELPQFFNVLRGDMSLVGPRPELPYLVEKYQSWQRKRFAVPPGITGWWQVSGRSDKPMHLNTEDDLYYISNYSVWLDLQILVRTLWAVLLGKGAY
jgi:exopolysaccharide biosynthesis polyprenyl glycosylphosphotransferase